MSRKKPEDDKPDDFLPGDDMCKSCTGLLYFSREMKKNAHPPLCIGVSSVLKKKIPHDKLERMDKQTKRTDLGKFIVIGYSQFSGRMERNGGLPICLMGVQLHFSTRVTPTNDKNIDVDGVEVKMDKNSEITQASMILLAAKYHGYLSSGSKKMYSSMKTVLSKTIDNFPGRLMQSGTRMLNSSAKTCDRLKRGWLKFWSRIW